jgi:hypothetical protein
MASSGVDAAGGEAARLLSIMTSAADRNDKPHVDERISDLKRQKDMLRAERNRVGKALKLEQKKRLRLKSKLAALSQDDLIDALVIRASAKPKAKAAAHR